MIAEPMNPVAPVRNTRMSKISDLPETEGDRAFMLVK